MDDLLADSIDWAMASHRKHFNSSIQWSDRTEFLAQAGLIEAFLPDEEYVPSFKVTLAGLLLFGKAARIKQNCPSAETVVITNREKLRHHKNIVESVRELCLAESSVLPSLLPQIPPAVIQELLVNGYVHRCYRTPSSLEVQVSQSGLEIQNAGELLSGLTVGNLIYGTPVYRNLLLAEAARFAGLCDKLGQGIDVVYRDVLSGGLGFPEFESGNYRFTARIPLVRNEKFKAFVRKRSQALGRLDYIIVLQLLWSRDTASLGELSSRMQRKEEFALRLLNEMCEKRMIESVPSSPSQFQLASVVREDIDKVFQSDQMSLELAMWGELPN